MSREKNQGETVLEVGGNQSLAGLCEMGFVKSVAGFCDGRKSSKMKRENVTRRLSVNKRLLRSEAALGLSLKNLFDEDYEEVLFSDYDNFISEYEKGKAVIDPGLEWSSDPLVKIKLSHPSKIPRPSPTPIPTIDSNLQPLIIELDPFHVPKWFSETEISEKERYECSVYGEMLLDGYNQVKGTDFELVRVRLVKMKLMFAAGVHFKIQFEAKPRAAAEYTLKTFEGSVFKDCVFHHKVWPQSCRLLSLNRDSVYDEEYRRPM